MKSVFTITKKLWTNSFDKNETPTLTTLIIVLLRCLVTLVIIIKTTKKFRKMMKSERNYENIDSNERLLGLDNATTTERISKKIKEWF